MISTHIDDNTLTKVVLVGNGLEVADLDLRVAAAAVVFVEVGLRQ